MNFGTITVNQSMGTEQNCVIWILIALLFMLKLRIFINTNDVEIWFDTSNYDENDERRLPIGKNKKIPGLFERLDQRLDL